MSWYLDLAWQVIGLLRTSFGGTGNARGWSTGVVKRCVNATGSTLTRGTLVRLLASDLGDARVEPTTTANEIDVLGVVVGYYTASDRERLIEDDAPSPGWVAVMTSGSCPVARIGSEGASRGQYAFASADDGKIKGASDIDAGAFGVWQGVKPPYALELWGVVLQGVGAAGGSLRVKEVDGSPNVSPVSVVRVSSGHLTDDGSGQVTIDIPDAYTAPGFGSPTDIGIANADGSGTTYPHSNHVHKHPVIGSGDLHPEYTTVAELATGVSAAETYSDAALAGHAGTANAHTTFGSPVAIGTADADGSGTTVPHASHVHAHGTFASGNYHPEYAGAGATGSALAGIFGDGSDGDAHCDGSSAVPGMSRVGSVYTMSRDAWYGNLHVDPGVTVQMCSSLVPNYRLFCSGALWNEGTITATGNAGADGGHNSGDQAGGGFNAATLGGSRAGGNGSAGASNGNAGATADTTVGFGGASGAGGNSGAFTGGAARTPGTAAGRGQPRDLASLLSGLQSYGPTISLFTGGEGGGGGASDTASERGGGGGGGGGVLELIVYELNNAGTIAANGGKGGNGTTANAAGGGGGGGGVVAVVYRKLTALGTITANGGSKGTGSGSAGAAGDGSAGKVITFAA